MDVTNFNVPPLAFFAISVSSFYCFSSIKKHVLGIADAADEVDISGLGMADAVDEVDTKTPTDLSSAEKKTSRFLNLIPEMKVEICSFLSPREKTELLKFLQEDKEYDEHLVLEQLYSGIRTDDDIRAAVKAWCADPAAAEIKYGHISLWDTSSVTNMSELFKFFSRFNDDISAWNVGNVTNMGHMFLGAHAFNQPLEQWNVGNVTNMEAMFSDARAFNQPLEQWNVGNVTNMGCMFSDARAFNQPIEQWNVGNVTNMGAMFWDAHAFNQPLEQWNVGNVTNMEAMFHGARAFNQPLEQWNVGNVTNMGCMFYGARAFNQPLQQWNVGNVTNMGGMFYGARAFNQPLQQWNVGNVTNMEGMFCYAYAFNQPLWRWNLPYECLFGGGLRGFGLGLDDTSSMSPQYKDGLLLFWGGSLLSGMVFRTGVGIWSFYLAMKIPLVARPVVTVVLMVVLKTISDKANPNFEDSSPRISSSSPSND